MPILSKIKRSLRFPVLYTAKHLGLFRLSRMLTRRGLRILCYHGGALDDEHRFSPGTFMTQETFRRRMEHLTRHGYPVLGLEEALSRMDDGTLPDAGTVVAIDDGWYGTYAKMVPVLKALGFPATIYVTTYYVSKGTEVFNMFVGYLLWRGAGTTLDLSQLDDRITGSFDLADGDARARAQDRIISFAESTVDAAERHALALRLARMVGYDADEALKMGLFRLMNRDELASLSEHGIDIQLHTHRHRLPTGSEREVAREIRDNADVLEPITGKKLTHFCYPSGRYAATQLPWLEALGIESATTTDHGFNYPDTPKLLLRRFLDSETVSDIEFEAELSGFFEILRKTGIHI